MGSEIQSRPEGNNKPVEVHLHNNVSIPPPQNLTETVKEFMAARDDDGPVRPRRRRRPQPRGRFGAFWVRFVAILWEVGGLLLLGFLNVLVLSKGLTELSPSLFGAKMSAMPGFSMMASYQIWNKV